MSAIAVAAVLPFVAATAEAKPASAAPAADDRTDARSDNRIHPLATQRSSLRQRAVDELVSGAARLKGRGADRTIRMADGTTVDYPVSQNAQLLTFLVDFGGDGPTRNEIPKPAASDNTTYWKADFDRQHYMDMFFNGMPEQDGESFKKLYAEMSSGRFDLEGDVSDWVTVPDNEASYGQTESNEDMTRFIGDSANAWYDAALEDMTEQEVKDYLAQFDVWDRYDLDGDGEDHEPDGYIDHFQAVHAGEGEEAGAPESAIWSHRWAANLAGYDEDGPAPGSCEACYPIGGVQIGDTGYFIYDYTTEPENGGLGVFAHEFGHDLGLPDYYDTAGGDNSNGYWTLMDSGSWLGHGQGSIGTAAGHMGPTEKLFLGWYGAKTADGYADLAQVDGLSATAQEVVLGPSYHATRTGKQAVLVNLPAGHASATGPAAGDYLYSGTKDGAAVQATSPTIPVPAGSASLTASVRYDIETDFDYAYLEVSDDGGTTWQKVETSHSSSANPNGSNLGQGITGSTDDAFVDLSANLASYAGKNVQLRWEYVADGNTHGYGLIVDSLTLGSYSTTFTDASDWTLADFYPVLGGEYQYDFTQYYMAENRTFDGYDEVLAQGPYSLDYAGTAPNKVDHYSYEDGLLLYYSNGAHDDNNTSEHPGYGANLPVDSHPETITWSGTGANGAANGRLQSFDATFDVDQHSAVNLTREVSDGTQSVSVPARAAIPVFEDSDVNAYYDATGGEGWFSTKVAGAGTEIQVLSSDEATGTMVVKIGAKFVAALGSADLTGTAQKGQSLTATAPSWFQTGVTTTVAWLRDGSPVAGATGSTYAVQVADVGHTVSAQITGAKAGYTSTTVTTTGLPATQAGAPSATTAPKISGTARVGKTLKVTGAAWSEAGTSTYSWTVGTQQVGTGTSYALKPADAGKKVTVTETFTSPGQATATASTSSATVAKAKVNLSLQRAKAKKGKKVAVTVRATSPGLKVPGKVTIRYAGKKVRTVALKNGSATVKLPAKSRGSYRLKVSYSGATGFASESKAVTVKVK